MKKKKKVHAIFPASRIKTPDQIVGETVTNFLSEASVLSLNKCYFKKILTGDVSENDILIVFPPIRGKLNFRKVVGAAAFLLWRTQGI